MSLTQNGSSRRERERQSRSTAMLNAAKEVFAEKGYSGATLEEIAQRSEFGKGTIYNYFPEGKQQILLAIFDQLYDGLCELIEQSFQAGESKSFRDAMEAFISSCFQFFSERFNLFMILVKEAEQLGFSEDADRVSYFSRQQKRVLQTLAAPLQAAMERGEIRVMPAELLANMVFVNIKGYQMRHCPRDLSKLKDIPEVPTAEQASFLTDLILYGVSTSEYVEVAHQ